MPAPDLRNAFLWLLGGFGAASWQALGIFGAVGASGASLGMLLGGIITQILGWRWCLYVNLLIAVPTAFVALGWLGEYAFERGSWRNAALLLKHGFRYDHSQGYRDFQPFYARVGDSWNVIDYSKQAKDWMHPLKHGHEIDLAGGVR